MFFLREVNLRAENSQRDHKREIKCGQKAYLAHSVFSWQHLKIEKFLKKNAIFIMVCAHWSPCPMWHSLVELWWPWQFPHTLPGLIPSLDPEGS
jgi:hypothetical protein